MPLSVSVGIGTSDTSTSTTNSDALVGFIANGASVTAPQDAELCRRAKIFGGRSEVYGYVLRLVDRLITQAPTRVCTHLFSIIESVASTPNLPPKRDHYRQAITSTPPFTNPQAVHKFTAPVS
uniref:MIF4G domain-containing protein n=1 Tax=Mesocestoides corti TaxID=53468 RepID=A0A5K3FZL4_MESCO